MVGTSFSATAAIRWMPPSSTAPTATVISSPGTHGETSSPKPEAASTKVRTMVFDWAMLPVPRSAVAAPKTQNMIASTFAIPGDLTPAMM